jgi:hypothetical protein
MILLNEQSKSDLRKLRYRLKTGKISWADYHVELLKYYN